MVRELKVAMLTLAMGISSFTVAASCFAQPTYNEDMARQRAQEQAIIEEGSYDHGGEDDRREDGGENGDYAPRRSWVARPPAAWSGMIAHLREQTAVPVSERMKDPIYRNLANGVWTYTSSDPKDPHKLCAATFWTSYGGVTLINWADDSDLTFLGFFGMRVPKSDTPQKVRLSITQSGETQTVNGFKMTFPPVQNLGMVLFLVPSFDALVNSIEDKQDFTVATDGEPFAQGAWHSGLQARARLQACRRATAR